MDASQLPDDLNPEVVKATAEFIGKISGLVPPPHNAFPPEWHGYLRTFTSRLQEIACENAAPVAPAAAAPSEDAYIAQRMTETLADVYATIIGNDEQPEDRSLNAIERVKKAAQVLRLEVDLYRAQRDELASMTRMFNAVCSALGLINEALGLDPDDAGADPILSAIEELKARIVAPAAKASFQDRVQPWLLECFGPMIAGDREERNHRFLEEALELVQACGCTAHEAHQLVDYTFGRPIGEPMQEVGGVMVTLAALCLANGLDMHAASEAELARISVPETVAKIRAKQAAKPKHSPLPAALPSDAAQAPKARGDHAIWLLEHIVDVHDDAMNNAPADRCYAEGAWKATLTDVREFLGTPVSHVAAAPSSARETLIADYPEFDIPTYGHHDVLALLDWSKHAREFIDASNTATPAPLAAGLTEQAVELIDKLMKRYGHEFYVSKDGVNGPTQYDVASKHSLIARAIALLATTHGDKQ